MTLPLLAMILRPETIAARDGEPSRLGPSRSAPAGRLLGAVGTESLPGQEFWEACLHAVLKSMFPRRARYTRDFVVPVRTFCGCDCR